MRTLRALLILLAAVMSVPITPATAIAAAAPRLVDVRASHHPGFDRVVFEFEGGVPDTVTASFVPRLIADGSGLPVRIAGRAILRGQLPVDRRRTAARLRHVVAPSPSPMS